MKSAYERALEKLESKGIAAPRQDALDENQRRRIEDERSRHQAKHAELEILHRKNLSPDPAKRFQEEENYRAEKRRLSDRLESKSSAFVAATEPGAPSGPARVGV